jgi:CheY-like chemotaxis protein
MVEERSSEANEAVRPAAILIVEDEVLVRLALEEDLTAAGYNVIQAADVSEALQILRSEIELDLMLSDIRMPGPMTGIELARWAQAIRPNLAIALISGNLADVPADLMVDGLIEKPYVPLLVINCINELLSRRDHGTHQIDARFGNAT